MPFLRKYATLTVTGTTAIRIPIIKRAVVDFAVGADWTPAAGDVKIAIDGTAPANVTNLPTAVTSGTAAFWEFVLTAAELTCKQAVVTVSKRASVEDQSFIVETFGNASAMYQPDFSDSVRFGLTALPNVAAAGNGGLPTVDANNRVKCQGNIAKNVALVKFAFLMTDSTNHNPATGKTVTCTRSIDGGAFGTGTLANVGVEVANGIYNVDFGAADLNGNTIVLRCIATGADDTFIIINTFV